MPLDYQGVPQFSRERSLFLSRIDTNQLSTFVEKQTLTKTPADTVFDEITKLFIKGEVLKNGLANMNPAGFIPVEAGASVITSIQRLYPGNDNYQSITFGMFKTACEAVAERYSALDENFILNFNAVDPKLENSSVTVTHKSIKIDSSDWLTQFLDRLSPFAGMLIAGKMADLSFLISPQLDVNSEGGTGAFKSWGAQGTPVAISLLIELGFGIYEYNRTFKNHSNIPNEVHQAMQSLHNDPAKREQILTDAGFDYSSLKSNQSYNDSKAIKDYALAYISRNQDNLNFHHWIAYSQVVQSQSIVRSVTAMAPTFSNKWRKFYKIGSTTDTQIDVLTVSEEVTGLEIALNNSLSSYIGHLNDELSQSYNNIYQSFVYQVDPKLICCLVWFLGPIDLDSLKKLSTILTIASTAASFNPAAMLIDIGEGVMVSLTNMLCYYLNIVLDQVIRQISLKLFNIPPLEIDLFVRYCLGINLVFNALEFALNYIIGFIESILDYLHSIARKLSSRQNLLSVSNANSRALMTLKAFIDHIISSISAVQPLCEDKHSGASISNDQIADQTFNFVTAALPQLFPVIQLSESDKRKHFSNLRPFDLPALGIEVPGTTPQGASTVYTKGSPTECGSENSAVKNIELGKRFADYLRGI